MDKDALAIYIASSILVLLALITATGVLDRFNIKKYGPGFVNGRFTLWKRIIFNPKRMRFLTVGLLLITSFVLLSMQLFGLTENTAAAIILTFAAIYVLIGATWAVEK